MQINDEINALTRTRQFTQALLMTQQWVNEDSSNHKAWAKLSQVYSAMGDMAEAEKSIDKALDISPKIAHYIFQKGLITYKIKNFLKAQNIFESCVAICQARKDIFSLDISYLAQAKCLIILGDKKKAKALLVQASDKSCVWLNDKITKEELLKEV